MACMRNIHIHCFLRLIATQIMPNVLHAGMGNLLLPYLARLLVARYVRLACDSHTWLFRTPAMLLSTSRGLAAKRLVPI